MIRYDFHPFFAIQCCRTSIQKETEKIWMGIMCLTCVRHSKKFGKWMITGKNTGAHVIFVMRWAIRDIGNKCHHHYRVCRKANSR